MFNSPVFTWTFTVVLVLSGSYHFLQAIRFRQLTDRVNNSLHALMHVLMAAMLWNLAPSTRWAQIAILGCATFWFIIQAVARPEFKTPCAGSRGWPKCVYHGFAMAGAAVMIVMMGQGTTAGPNTAPASGMAGMHHHGVADGAPVTTAATLGPSPAMALLLTVFFAMAAVIFFLLLLRFLATRTALAQAAAPRLSVRAEYSIEALGAAVMALMFATMTA